MVGDAAGELLDGARLGDDGEEVGHFGGGEIDGEDSDAFQYKHIEGSHAEAVTVVERARLEGIWRANLEGGVAVRVGHGERGGGEKYG